jgi:DNA polymerase III delta prime subunit/antitoxin component of RelBE/YafQ-DinJ toxin-antitoxin module
MQSKFIEEDKVQYPKADAFIDHLIKIIKREHEEEIKGVVDHKKSYTQSQLENMGLAITNLIWMEFNEKTAEKGIIKFKHIETHESGQKKTSTQIKKGDKVQILKENATFSGKVLASGRIHEITSEVIVITVEGGQVNTAKNIPESYDIHYIHFSIYLKDTDYTHQCCKKALKSVMPVTSSSFYLYKVLLGIEKPRIHQIFPYPRIDQLNQMQQMAMLRALDAVDLYLIHGPPGTGKTKTLARYVVEEVNRGSKVIACCPSNIAVDNLLRELHIIKENMEVCRIGINEKMQDDATEFSLEAQVASRNTTHIVYATKKIIEGSKVILATMAGISEYQAWKHLTKLHEQGQSFVVVIDEAAQATEPTCWVPLKIASKLVLAGDHMQLPPTVKCEDIKKDLGVTMFERLFDVYGNNPKHATTLIEQYRMCPVIMGWTSGEMYEGKLQAASVVLERTLMFSRWAEIKSLNLPEVNFITAKDMIMIDTAKQDRKEADDTGYSKYNPGEVEIIYVLVLLLTKVIAAESIGIISPYRSQVELLRRELIEKGKLKVKVSTIDGYQGREEDIIIISMVRSNNIREIGFLGDDRRINVAVTRARMQVIIVGDSDTICCRPFLRRLVEYIRVNGAIFNLNKEKPKEEEVKEQYRHDNRRVQGWYRRDGGQRRGRWRQRYRRGRYY